MSSKKHLTDFISQCHTILLNGTDEGVVDAIEYLHKERGLTEQSIKEHQIGYCPKYYDLPDEIRFYGATDEAEKDDENAKDFSYFICDRIIVPIYEEFGVVEAFATRKASSEKGNTWWNLSSPFKKGNHLFLLNKVRKNVFLENKIYLVEGYMDALLLYQKGLNKVCSLMGTHLTPRKIGLIARYCNHICLCLDVDENQSGQKGQDDAIAKLNQFGFSHLSIISGLPVGVDPDKYVIEYGIDKFLSMEQVLSAAEIKEISKKVFYRKKNTK